MPGIYTRAFDQPPHAISGLLDEVRRGPVPVVMRAGRPLLRRHDFPSQGTDAGKKIVGRKRGVITDALGLILAVTVTAASLSDNAIGIRLLSQVKNAYPTISKAWAGTGFKNAAVEHGATIGIDVEVVPRNTQTRGFHVLKRRWAVERTLGWLMLHRRLARDHETLTSSSEAMIHIASIDNLTRRITDETTLTWRGTY